MRVLKIVIAVAAVTATTPGFAQALWQNRYSGMSLADVMKLYPDAKSVTMSGKEALIKTDPIVVVGVPFTVSFEFNSEKLFRVRMRATNSRDRRPFANPMITYIQVSDELIKRYGRPIKFDRSSAINAESKYFLNSGISIRLNYMQISSMASISVEYDSSVGGEKPL